MNQKRIAISLFASVVLALSATAQRPDARMQVIEGIESRSQA
jgi:hypothetical protein